jgi:tetratricopeptide (TPR) repeat protein
MPLAAFVDEQMAALEAFMAAPDTVVRLLAAGPELRETFVAMLARRGGKPRPRRHILGFTHSFTDPVSWFEAMREALESALPNGPVASGSARPGPWAFLLRAEAYAEALPEESALVFVIVAPEISAPDDYRRSIAFLVERVRSKRLKFIALDDRMAPVLPAPAPGQTRLTRQACRYSPQEPRGGTGPTGMASDAAAAPDETDDPARAGAFALASGDAAKAETLQRAALQRAIERGSPPDEASAAASLGATLLTEGKVQEAAEVYFRGCDVCSQHKLTGLAPLLYKGLAFSLHRLGEKEQAYSAFRTARGFLNAAGNLIGEAHLCGGFATLLAADGRKDEAVRIWRYVRGLYDRMEEPALAEARSGGIADVEAKLRKHGA